jgi:hypothetical protein
LFILPITSCARFAMARKLICVLMSPRPIKRRYEYPGSQMPRCNKSYYIYHDSRRSRVWLARLSTVTFAAEHYQREPPTCHHDRRPMRDPAR